MFDYSVILYTFIMYDKICINIFKIPLTKSQMKEFSIRNILSHKCWLFILLLSVEIRRILRFIIIYTYN